MIYYIIYIIYHNRLNYDTVLFVNMLCSSFFLNLKKISKSRKYIKLLLILNPSPVYLQIGMSHSTRQLYYYFGYIISTVSNFPFSI